MLIDRLVREVIKMMWGVLARVVFLGFWVGNRGLFRVFCCCRESEFGLFAWVVWLFLFGVWLVLERGWALSHCTVGGLYGCGFN